jgi:hypothetical protein
VGHVVENDGQDGSGYPEVFETGVKVARREDALGTDEAENYRGVEEDVSVGASEVVWLASLADVCDVSETPFQDRELHEAGPERCNCLSEEDYALGDFEIEAKFQVLKEGVRLVHRDVPISLE